VVFSATAKQKNVGGLSHFPGQPCLFSGNKGRHKNRKAMSQQEEELINAFYNTVGEILALTIKVTGAFHKHSNHVFLCTNCNLLKTVVYVRCLTEMEV
jgi:hypothetical protein